VLLPITLIIFNKGILKIVRFIGAIHDNNVIVIFKDFNYSTVYYKKRRKA